MNFERLCADMDDDTFIPTFEDLNVAVWEAQDNQSEHAISLIRQIVERMENTHVMTPRASFDKTEAWLERQHDRAHALAE